MSDYSVDAKLATLDTRLTRIEQLLTQVYQKLTAVEQHSVRPSTPSPDFADPRPLRDWIYPPRGSARPARGGDA